MKKRVEGLVRQFREARKRRLRFEALMTALSVLVTGGVFWQLRRQGTAISDETAPAAELPEAAIPVVETDADPPDETARSGIAEEPEDWEAELPVFTNESAQQRIAAIAVSQLGYSEGSEEVLLSDDGMSRSGYTRYGAWYGNPYGEWNSLFTYFCMYYAGIEKTEIPYGSGCWSWYETLSEKEMIAPCGTEEPGDILFFDTDADGEADRTGIVTGTAETEEGVQISVIEGNTEGTVAEKQYLRGGSEMIGVLSVDDYVADLPEGVKLIDYSGDTESGIHVAAQAAAGVFPKGTVMKAADVADDEAMQAAAEAHGEDATILDAVAVDISFYNAEGEEIEPADGESVAVQITLPEEKQLAEGVHTLVHVDNEGGSALVDGANVTADGAVFEAESFSVYVMASTGKTAGDYYGGETIYLKVGESFRFEWVDASDTNMSLWNNWDTSGGYYYLTQVGSYDKWPEGDKTHHRVTYRADHASTSEPGLCLHTPSGENISIVITDDADLPIMVNSSHGYKDVNQIREWLGSYDGTTYSLEFPWSFGMHNEGGYVPNSKERPYIIRVGDTFDFYTDSSSAGDTFTYTFEDGRGGSASDVATITQSTGSTHHAVEVTGTNPGMIHFRFSGSNNEIWVKVMDRTGASAFSQTLNHADMEIADGGTYTISSTRVVNDVTYVDVKVYRAAITYVNDAYIYDANDNPVQHYTSEPDSQYPLYTAKVQRNGDGSVYYDSNDKPVFLDADGNPLARDGSGNQILKDGNNWLTVADTDYPIGDYEQFGVPGGTQYEMTSAWISNLSSKANKKTYDAMDADHAEFNVNMHLEPLQKYTYTAGPDGSLTLQSSDTSWDGADDDLANHDPENILFKLNHQDVLDAMNKCPLNNGLDFTARAEFTVLQLPVEKKLLNGTLTDNQFTFDVIDLNPEKLNSTQVENNVAIADSTSCNAAGEAMLSSMRFGEAGTYYFKLKERVPEPEKRGGFDYDETEIYFKVVVEKANDTGFLVAIPVFLSSDGTNNYQNYPIDTERKKAEFTNYYGYELPHTGGTGTLPFMAGGMLLISAAFVLPLIRRRKEDEADS